MSPHLALIDGSGFIYRSYWALPALHRQSDGLMINAVLGFSEMLWRLVRQRKYTHVAVVFDAGSLTFRHELFPAYKANREGPPGQLVPQFPLIRQATEAFGVAQVELDGYEADDLIATYARIANQGNPSFRVTIVSSDKDFYQVVTDAGIGMFDPIKKVEIGEPEVFAKFGVWPSQMVGFQALMGDSVDNVPGCPGIGAKTAAALIREHGSLNGVLDDARSAVAPTKLQTRITHYLDEIAVSERLVTLDEHVPVEVAVEDFERTEFEPRRALAFLDVIESVTLRREIETACLGSMV